ncbi:hypothetical protein AMJ49_04825 [Parcubacteria bacterium DG_74_2]|nr:MAG: hypothetical protein AMJ49_04825 [Parcubacteria bacterium DG_74_2]
MRTIIAFLIVIAVLSIFSSSGQSPDSFSKQTDKKQSIVESAGQAAIVKPEKPSAVSAIDTLITAGPESGETIEETNKVVFEFEAKIPSKEAKSRIFFETKIIGFDDDWQKTSSKKRKITLPLGPKEYTFLVRAKTKDSTDITPAQRTFKINVSPYFEKVRISKVTIPSSSRPSLTTLITNLKEEEKINITGWQIKGRNGSAVIPQGIKKWLPGYNYADKDIFIKQGDKIYLSGSSNPLGKNRNFLNNKCFGYIAKSKNFITPVSGSCPKPEKEEISHLHICCQEFINRRVNRCFVPDYSKNFKIYNDSECVDFLNETFNYEGCFRKYSRDEDFLRNDWHIYLSTEIAADSYCDTIYLTDQNGLVVDKYSYGRDICR